MCRDTSTNSIENIVAESFVKSLSGNLLAVKSFHQRLEGEMLLNRESPPTGTLKESLLPECPLFKVSSHITHQQKKNHMHAYQSVKVSLVRLVKRFR